MSRIEFSLGDVLSVARFIRETFVQIEAERGVRISEMSPEDADKMIASHLTKSPKDLIMIGEMRAKGIS